MRWPVSGDWQAGTVALWRVWKGERSIMRSQQYQGDKKIDEKLLRSWRGGIWVFGVLQKARQAVRPSIAVHQVSIQFSASC
jgi:hypothetical protein